MSRRRVYLAASPADLVSLARSGRLDPCGRRAFAVTAAARASFPEADDDELEYDAFVLASRAGPPLGQPGPPAPPWWAAVLSVDLPGEEVVDAPAPGAGPEPDPESDPESGYEVSLGGTVRLGEVACVHLAAPEAEPEEELLWYDIAELPTLVSDPAMADPAATDPDG